MSSSNNTNPFLDQAANANKATSAWKFAAFTMAGLSAFLTVALIYQARNAPTVLVPYGFATAVEVSKVTTNGDINGTSVGYISSLAIADLNLILNMTPDDSIVQTKRFLARVTPELFGAQNENLLAIAEEFRRSATTQAFYPLEAKVSRDGTTVEVSGKQVGYVGGKQVSLNVVTYIVKYTVYKGYFHVADLRPKDSK